MNARNCPKCQRELPVETLRALEQGTACPFCATRLKRTPRRAPTAPLPADDYATLEVSHTPAVVAQPTGEDSYRWFQTKGSPGGGAVAAAVSPPVAAAVSRPAPVVVSAPVPASSVSPPAPVRSPLKTLPTVAMPGLTPSTSAPREPVPAASAPVPPVQVVPAQAALAKVAASPVAPPQVAPAKVAASPVTPAKPATVAVAATEVQKRPVSFDPPRAPQPAEPRRAPTLVGTAPPPPAEKPSPPVSAQPSSAPVAAPEPPRAALAMAAVLPSSGSTLALASPVLAFPERSRRTTVVAAGAAVALAVVALLVFHRSSGDGLPIAGAPAQTKLQVGSAPLATLHETSGTSPTIQPLHAESDTAPARAAEAAPAADTAGADLERGAGTRTTRSHGKVRTAHHATAHERRYAKHEKHAKYARHERRHAHGTEVASRSGASPGDDSEARASYQRGNTLLFAGDPAGAVAAYQKAVELAPADPIGYRGLGLAHEQKGETGAAVRALRKYLKLAPGAADREIISRRIARLSQSASRQ